MKQKIAFTSGIIALMISCTKLDEDAYDQVLESSFQPTEKDVPSIIAPAYTVMRGMMAGWQGYFDLQEEPADIIVTPARPNGWYDGGTYQRMHYHEWNSIQWQPQNLWINCYAGINNVNRILYQIDAGSIPISTGKENTIAELKTVRAFYYSLLLDNHGNVPIVTDFQDTSLPKQSTRQQVYDFTVQELLDNMNLLREQADNTTYGRFNKWAAKALLARIYLNAEVYTGTPQWEKCIEQCDDVLGSGQYHLEDNYKSCFVTDNHHSKEIILAVPYDEIYGTGNTIHMKTLAPLHRQVLNMTAQPWGGNCAVPQFINTYDPDDSRLNDTWLNGPQYNVTGGELILTYTKEVDGIELSGQYQGYRIGKFEIKPGARDALSTDFPIFRYAEIKLMKAECLLRTGRAEEAAQLVTEVRERAFGGNPAKATVTGAQLQMGSSYQYGYWQNNAVTELQGGADIPYGRMLDELGWEFAAEAHRRMDLIRFGVFTRKKWFNHRPRIDGKPRTLFPIPEPELAKNSNLQQNPDYN
jgi:SusD family.